MPSFSIVLTVALGGALGCSLRYITTFLMTQTLGSTFPYGTWAVNAVGSFLIGILSVYLSRHAASPFLAAFLIAGFLGGFTTFSSFANEAMQFIAAGRLTMAMGYIGLQLGFGLFLCGVGMAFGYWIS